MILDIIDKINKVKKHNRDITATILSKINNIFFNLTMFTSFIIYESPILLWIVLQYFQYTKIAYVLEIILKWNFGIWLFVMFFSLSGLKNACLYKSKLFKKTEASLVPTYFIMISDILIFIIGIIVMYC